MMRRSRCFHWAEVERLAEISDTRGPREALIATPSMRRMRIVEVVGIEATRANGLTVRMPIAFHGQLFREREAGSAAFVADGAVAIGAAERNHDVGWSQSVSGWRGFAWLDRVR